MPNTEVNFSYEMKYGDGQLVKIGAIEDYNYFENILDINTYLSDNLYIYTQVEYSDPPIFGYTKDGLNKFYIEYKIDFLSMKLGDLYELYGRGMSFYTLQDQNVDYDNSIKGLSISYMINDNLSFSGLVGKGDYHYRSNPAELYTNRQFNSNVMLMSVDYEHHNLGFFQFVKSKQNSFINPALTGLFSGTETDINYELNDRLENCIILNECSDPNLITIASFYSVSEYIDTLSINNNNFNWNIFLGPFDIYLDKAWLNYNKVFGSEVFGSRFYTSVYTDFFGTGITYEFKKYFTPYLLKSISNPPIVYREGNSILASRNAHSINFGNEIGHQIDFNKNLFDVVNLSGNLSISRKNQMDEMKIIDFTKFLLMEESDGIYDYNPYRQIYFEINGWTMSEKLFYKIGVDHYNEILDKKNTKAITLPTQWVWKLDNRSSITMYIEAQKKEMKDVATINNYSNKYISVSYNYLGKWTLTGFYDNEKSKDKTDIWPGFDVSYYINNDMQISIFYGSQKGGLVCANGICAEQPGFENGYKLTFRSLF